MVTMVSRITLNLRAHVYGSTATSSTASNVFKPITFSNPHNKQRERERLDSVLESYTEFGKDREMEMELEADLELEMDDLARPKKVRTRRTDSIERIGSGDEWDNVWRGESSRSPVGTGTGTGHGIGPGYGHTTMDTVIE